MIFSLSPFALENLVSQDGFGSPVPWQAMNPNTKASSSVSRWAALVQVQVVDLCPIKGDLFQQLVDVMRYKSAELAYL